jgi:hypothetical protein
VKVQFFQARVQGRVQNHPFVQAHMPWIIILRAHVSRVFNIHDTVQHNPSPDWKLALSLLIIDSRLWSFNIKFRRSFTSLHLHEDCCPESTRKCCQSRELSSRSMKRRPTTTTSRLPTCYFPFPSPPICRSTKPDLPQYLLVRKTTKDSHAKRQIHNYISFWRCQT